MNRRTFVGRGLLAAGASRLLWAQQSWAQQGEAGAGGAAVVRTVSGPLRGEVRGGVRVFRGVPFAEAPVGPLRFRAPVPVRPWTEVRDATQFAAEAMQPDAGAIPESEDCLYLNVWAPAEPGPHPVFVWIHGGGFTGGRSFDPMQDGTGFAQQGIVCVTVAYRLGVFGFLDMEPLLGPAYAGSANNALRDLILALQWVQANGAAFGGDPRQVTIGGESAGAKLTDVLMGVPAAAGLFQGMISESGGAERVWPKGRAAEIAQQFGATWMAGPGTPGMDALRTMPAAALIAAQERFTRESAVHFPLRCEVDGTLLPEMPLEAIRGGSARGKRLLLGTNREESALFIGAHPATDPGAKDLGNLSVAQFRPVEAEYAQIYPEMSAEMRRIRSLTAEEYWVPSLRVADAHVAAGGTAYVYEFEFPDQGGAHAGLAVHAAELKYVWDHVGQAPAAKVAALATTMHAAWAAFLKGGAPAAAGLPAWPLYDPRTRPTMVLDAECRVEMAPQAAEFAAWKGFLER